MVLHLFHTKIKLEYSFVLMLTFALLCGYKNLLSLLLFASLHEVGHIAVLLLLGGRADEITIAFYGIGLKHSARLTTAGELCFLLSGIIVNAAFALLGIGKEINYALFVINALPVYPLDMGRALALFLPYRVARGIGIILTLAIFIYAAFARNISALFIGIYIIIFTLKEEIPYEKRG